MNNTALPVEVAVTTPTTHHTLSRLLYDRVSAARELGISPRTLDSLIARRELTFRRIGTRVLIPANEIYRLTTGTATPLALDRLAFSRDESARLLSISTRSIDHLISGRVIKAQRIGHRVLVPTAELRRMARADHPFPVVG